MTAAAIAGLAGKFRIHRLRDGFVDFEAFQRTPHYDIYHRQLGVDDRLWVVSPIGPDAESYFIFDKRRQGARFTDADAELASHVLRGLTWFQRQLMNSYGLPVVESPLTAMERRVVRLLLSDKSEKEIATALKQSPHTAHGHIKEIFRKYGVQGRVGFLALWLSGR
jgi:DNA-binding CsgD family transcriptional regulator